MNRNRKNINVFVFVLAMITVPGSIRADQTEEQSEPTGLSEDYIPVNRAELQTVSGKALVIASYGTVFFILLLYATSLVRREYGLRRHVDALKKRRTKK
ncbi:MAG: hypothetical protein QNJ97_02915 [Myxococcota bacterium]|nr:hypothetical protein [Myxococcota bacterium]